MHIYLHCPKGLNRIKALRDNESNQQGLLLDSSEIYQLTPRVTQITLIFSEAKGNTSRRGITPSLLPSPKSPQRRGALSAGFQVGHTLALKKGWALEHQVGGRLVTLALEWHLFLMAQETAKPDSFRSPAVPRLLFPEVT